MGIQNIHIGSIVVLKDVETDEIKNCILATGRMLIDLQTGIKQSENISLFYDDEGFNIVNHRTRIIKAYRNINDFNSKRKPVLTLEDLPSFAIGSIVVLRDDLEEGIHYGCLKCSQVAAHFAGVPLVVQDKMNGILKVSYKGSKCFGITPSMLKTLTPSSTHSIVSTSSNPFAGSITF